jgi:hypothetical protein
MPSPDTFSIPPVRELLAHYLSGCAVIVDPFARNSTLGTITNDLNPNTTAQYHMDAVAFCEMLAGQGVRADAVLLDPPYSPRQIAEIYQSIGRAATTTDTQNAHLYREVRQALAPLLKLGGPAVSCGWNSAGFGPEMGFEPTEYLLVCHGGAHHDTIVTVERKVCEQLSLLTREVA